MSVASISFTDVSDERSVVSFNLEDASGATYDYAGLQATLDTVADAIEAVTLCTRGKEVLSQVAALGSSALPASEFAQRESGLRVFYQDDVTAKKYHFTIPGPDMALMVSPGFDVVDWTGTEMAALEVALEANMLSPDGNAITIITGTIVGRRN